MAWFKKISYVKSQIWRTNWWLKICFTKKTDQLIKEFSSKVPLRREPLVAVRAYI